MRPDRNIQSTTTAIKPVWPGHRNWPTWLKTNRQKTEQSGMLQRTVLFMPCRFGCMPIWDGRHRRRTAFLYRHGPFRGQQHRMGNLPGQQSGKRIRQRRKTLRTGITGNPAGHKSKKGRVAKPRLTAFCCSAKLSGRFG